LDSALIYLEKDLNSNWRNSNLNGENYYRIMSVSILLKKYDVLENWSLKYLNYIKENFQYIPEKSYKQHQKNFEILNVLLNNTLIDKNKYENDIVELGKKLDESEKNYEAIKFFFNGKMEN